MNPGWLLQHFAEISEAPEAVPRLRRFILDLAVRGKLVEQDVESAPASELLERIRLETARLVAAGETRLQGPLDDVTTDELGFAIPSHWTTCRLGEVAICLDYRRIPVNNEERTRRIEGKDPAGLFPYYGATQQQGWIDDFIFDEEIVLLGEDGVPFFDQLRPKAYLVSGKSWVNNHAHVFRGVLVSNQFLVHWLNVFDYAGRVAGATRSKLNQSKAIDIPMPLPPLAEQHRIVAKVDELMALCAELEAAQANRERRRDRLVAATLHGLANGDGSAEAGARPSFEDSACFYFNQLPRLATRPEHIHQLQQTILSLALRGKLVRQDPTDEPASHLLARVEEWRAEAIRERIVRMPRKPLKRIEPSEIPYALPDGWEWVRLGALIYIRSGDALTSENMKSGDIPVYGGNGVNGYHDAANIEDFTIVIGRVGYYCGSVHVTPKRAWVTDNAFIAKFCSHEILLQFLVLLLKGTNLKEDEGATAQPVISGAKIYPLIVAIPPFKEQHRIVAKVDELMALCDELEARISATATTRRRLLDATLHEALEGRKGPQ